MILQIVVTKRADGLFKVAGMDAEKTVYSYDGLNIVELNSYFGILQQKLAAP